MLVIPSDLRIARIVDELVTGVHVRTADNHHVVRAAAVGHPHCPGSAAFGVTGGQVGCHHRSTEFHLVAVTQHTVDFGGRIVCIRGAAIAEIVLAAGFDIGDVSLHHDVLRTGHLLDLSA